MNDSALGSALVIPEAALKKIQESDEKLAKIQKTAEQTASSVKSSFGTMEGGAKGFISSLDQIIAKLGTINSKASQMSGSLSNLGTGNATQQISQMNSVASKAAKSIDSMAASQHKVTNSADFSKSVTDWQNLQAQIVATNKRQQELTQTMRRYEMTMSNIQNGKGGVIYKGDKENYVAAQKEFEANKQVISSLREKQQQIIANNQALNQQISMLNSLKSYHVDSGSLDSQRSKNTLAEMRAYYKELEKSSAREAKAEEDRAKRVAAAAQKEAAARAKLYQQRNYEKNTTYNGAISFSDSANTLNRQAKAVQYLEAAKRKLSTTDEDYAAKLARLNARILYHNELLEKAKTSTAMAGAKSAAAAKEAQQQQNYFSNPSEVISNNSSVTTLRGHVNAIKELQQARLALDTTDKNYKKDLKAVNNAIRQHSKVLKDAGVNTRNLTGKTSYLAGYLSRLAQRTAVLFSISTAKDFVSQIAEVRGQFELSQKSLESIIQNKTKADQIFNKTVELAIKSPFRIKDLVDYVRQLSAYRIESDKLYDTTKRLADVSAGLGVDMSRLILAYGQVKAASYLRGSEVRQFTEAGVNMYGELQDYFKEVKGQAYSTAQIVDMISKRMVKFEDVEAIFQRMTDKGGMFYNMQETQANTLYGMIQKMHDAFDVMLNDIGKANEGTLKGTIQFATDMLKHWEEIAFILKEVAFAFVGMKLQAWGTFSAIGKGFSNAIVLSKMFWNSIKAWRWKDIGAACSLAFGPILKGLKAMSGALAGMAGYLAFEGIMKVVDTYREYNKMIHSAREAQIKSIATINDLIVQYNNLSTSAKDAGNAQNNAQSDTSAIEKKRALLQKLIKEAGKEGLEIKIDVASLDENEIEQQFQKVKDAYRDFVFNIEAIKERSAETAKWNFLPGVDSFDESLSEYKSKAVDVVSQLNKMETAVSTVVAHYGEATEETKRYFETMRAGRLDGEEDLAYMLRMRDALDGLASKERTGWIVELQSGMSELTGDFERLDNSAKKVRLTFKDVFVGKMGIETFKKKFQKDPIKLKAEIDAYAVDRSLSETERQLLYWVANHDYGIKIEADKNSVEDAINYVDETVQAFVDSKSYKIKIDIDNLNNPMKSWVDYFEDLEKEQKSLKKVYEWMKHIKATGKDVGKGLFKFSSSQFKDDELSFLGIQKNVFNGYGKAIILTAAQIEKLAKYQLGALDDTFKNYGWETDADKKATKEAERKRKAAERRRQQQQRQAAKQERDIIGERISLLKDMNDMYNNLIKTETKENAISMTRKYYKEAAQNVGWNTDTIMPDNATTAKGIEELGKKYKELAKRGNALRMSADVRFKISDEEKEKLKEEVSRNVEDAFSGLDLYKKLKGEGLTDKMIKGAFGDVATSFEDVRNQIDAEFNRYIEAAYKEKYGEDSSKWSEDVFKKYNEDISNTMKFFYNPENGMEDYAKDYKDKMQNLDNQIKQDFVNTFTELAKSYKTMLSDQLQLDAWYVGERRKIMENVSDHKLREQELWNLSTQYNKKSDENAWKSFTGKDSYIAMFQNVEYASTAAIDNMLSQLEKMKSSLKNLSPEQLKSIVEQMEKLREEKYNRNPFLGIAETLQEVKDAQKAYNDAIAEYNEKHIAADAATKLAEYELNEERKRTKEIIDDSNSTQQQKDEAQERETEALQRYNDKLKESNRLRENALNASLRLSSGWMRLANQIKNAAAKIQTFVSNVNELTQAITGQASSSLEKWGNLLGKTVDAVADVIKSIKDMKKSATSNMKLISDSSSNTIQTVTGAGTKAVDAVETTTNAASKGVEDTSKVASKSISAVEKASIILTIISAALQVATAIANLLNDESKIDKKIQEQERAVNALQYAYNKLKKSMENAYKIEDIVQYNKELKNNLALQAESYRQMLKAEESRKHPDESKKQEYRQQIESIEETIKEVGETIQEQLGGIGESNYKSAAEAFAQTWVEAFNEGSDALDALNTKFDEYIQNLIVKQATQRVVGKMMEPLFQMIDKAVSEGSDGANNGLELTKKELAEIQAKGSELNKSVNAALMGLMETLGWKGSGSSSLSKLQQGIQSVTESTAQALESVLNSMRYYLATQQADVRTIRDTLIARLGNAVASVQQDASNSPILLELRLQTTLLTDIRDTFASCVRGGHSQSGKGIKVFMN